MKFHYNYRISNIVLNKHYYGTRTSTHEPKNDIGINYFSSSLDKNFIKDQKENPQNYKYKVIKIFDNRKDALLFEIKLHNKFDVGINESFYNRSKQTSTGWDTTGRGDLGQSLPGEKNGMYGKTHTEEAKQKIRDARKRQGSNVWNAGQSGQYSEEYRNKISQAVTGRKFLIHPHTNHLTHAKPEDIKKLLEQGYVFGKKLKDPAPIMIA